MHAILVWKGNRRCRGRERERDKQRHPKRGGLPTMHAAVMQQHLFGRGTKRQREREGDTERQCTLRERAHKGNSDGQLQGEASAGRENARGGGQGRDVGIVGCVCC